MELVDDDEPQGHFGQVTGVACSPDGTRVVTASWETAFIRDARTGVQLFQLTGGGSCAAFSPDGTRIVTGGNDKAAKIWDARTGTLLLQVGGHPNGVTSVAFSPDGTRIVTGGGFLFDLPGQAKVWDARTGAQLLDLRGNTAAVTTLAFSRDGTRIVTGANDKTARVWDARTGTQLQQLKGNDLGVSSVAFSADGRFLARAEGNRVELVPWQPDAEELDYRRLHTQPIQER